MSEIFRRTEMLIGEDSVEKLKNSHVAIFGVGGVGGYIAESLARTGVGELTVVDNDTVAPSNINRQIIAVHSTIGMQKTQAIKNRLLDINPKIKVNCVDCFFTKETQNEIDFTKFDYIADAIDTVSSKILLVEIANKLSIKIISSMGAGNKLDPTAFKVADIYKTSVCPLARVMRTELRKRNIKSLKVVYSEEKALTPLMDEITPNRRTTPASIAFVPSVVGLIAGGEIIKDIIASE